MTCRNIFWRRRNQELVPLLGQGWGVPDDGPTGVRHGGGVTLASIRNVRTCRSDVKGAGQAGRPCKTGQSGEAHVFPIQDDNLIAKVPLRRSILQSTL